MEIIPPNKENKNMFQIEFIFFIVRHVLSSVNRELSDCG